MARSIYHLSDNDRRMIQIAIKAQTKTGYAKNAGLSFYGLSQILKKGSCFPSTYKALVKATKPREQEALERTCKADTAPTIRELLQEIWQRQQATLEMLGALQRDVVDLKKVWS